MRIKFSFAIRRNDFVEKVFNKLYGAMGEYYKTVVGNLVGYTQDIAHWGDEVDSHFDEVFDLLFRKTRSGFDKRAAFEEALEELSNYDMARRDWAIKRLRGPQYPKVSVPKSVSSDLPEFDQASKAFFARARQLLDDALVD